jgi:hypothetical protein
LLFQKLHHRLCLEIPSAQRIAHSGFGLDGPRCGVQTTELAIFEQWTGVGGMERNDVLKVTGRSGGAKRPDDALELKRRKRMRIGMME